MGLTNACSLTSLVKFSFVRLLPEHERRSRKPRGWRIEGRLRISERSDNRGPRSYRKQREIPSFTERVATSVRIGEENLAPAMARSVLTSSATRRSGKVPPAETLRGATNLRGREHPPVDPYQTRIGEPVIMNLTGVQLNTG